MNSSNITTLANEGPNFLSQSNDKFMVENADIKFSNKEQKDQNDDRSLMDASNNFEDSNYDEEFLELGVNPSKHVAKHFINLQNLTVVSFPYNNHSNYSLI